MNLTVLWPACVVHKTGCRDIAIDRKTRPDIDGPGEKIVGTSKVAVAEYIWEDQISDSTFPGEPDYEATCEEYAGYTEWKPCVTIPWKE